VDFTCRTPSGSAGRQDAFIEERSPAAGRTLQYSTRRREHARTDGDNDGIPTRGMGRPALGDARRADKAGGALWDRRPPGARDGTNLGHGE